MLGLRVQILFLLVLAISWVDGYARSLMISNVLVTEANYPQPRSESKTFDINAKNERMCTLCEQFASQAVHYFGKNKTQAEIIEALHLACSQLHPFRLQCVLLVDHYAPLFFAKIAMESPERFCEKAHFCKDMVFVPAQIYQDSCALSHYAVQELLTKLKDPDTQLEIIEMLLKGCDKMESYDIQLCKKLVFEYGLLILSNTEQFLETTDVCVSIHACKEEVDEVVSLADI